MPYDNLWLLSANFPFLKDILLHLAKKGAGRSNRKCRNSVSVSSMRLHAQALNNFYCYFRSNT